MLYKILKKKSYCTYFGINMLTNDVKRNGIVEIMLNNVYMYLKANALCEYQTNEAVYLIFVKLSLSFCVFCYIQISVFWAGGLYY